MITEKTAESRQVPCRRAAGPGGRCPRRWRRVCDGRPRAGVEHVGLDLDVAEAAVEGQTEQQELRLGVDRRAPDRWRVRGPSDVDVLDGRRKSPSVVVPTMRPSSGPPMICTASGMPVSQAKYCSPNSTNCWPGGGVSRGPSAHPPWKTTSEPSTSKSSGSISFVCGTRRMNRPSSTWGSGRTAVTDTSSRSGRTRVEPRPLWHSITPWSFLLFGASAVR